MAYKKTYVEKLAYFEGKIRPSLSRTLPPYLFSMLYSNSRKMFLKRFSNAKFSHIKINESQKIKLWDIEFNAPIFNAAGMFKNGEGYNVCANMGAGAYLAGTTTFLPRKGNRYKAIRHPFMPYPYSNASSNWMGLPNLGHQVVANKIQKIEKVKGCPIGISIAEDPEIFDINEQRAKMLEGMLMYASAGVDFIEMNFSCPNVKQEEQQCGGELEHSVLDSLAFYSEQFLQKRKHNIPVIVKYSNDIRLDILQELIDLLIELQYDGINIGNTSTMYEDYGKILDTLDRYNFNYFCRKCGGGISGSVLKSNSLYIASQITKILSKKQLKREFNCIRTGGIETSKDIAASQKVGVKMNQWFCGFFDNFAKNGFHTYEKLFEDD